MSRFSGVGVALVTPFAADFSIDYMAYERVIEHTLRGNVNYVVVLGTTGETPTLTETEKQDLLRFTVERVRGRVPLVVGIGTNDTQVILQQLRNWDFSGVDAILSVSPTYNKPSQEGIYQHFRAVAAATSLPIILYNVPGRTSSNMMPETVYRLAAEHAHIIGIKEASGNMMQAMALIKNRPEGFLLISGDDHLTLPLISCGFDGVISVVANAFPADFSLLVSLAMQGNFAEALPIHIRLLDKMDMLFAENNPAGIKAFLYEMGLIDNVLRLPLVPLSNHLHQKLKQLL
jgi:4-hydroxy-tetrahydrodipicolinate synthase